MSAGHYTCVLACISCTFSTLPVYCRIPLSYHIQVNDSLVKVDRDLGVLIAGLKQRQILDCVNIIITSDHGEDLS